MKVNPKYQQAQIYTIRCYSNPNLIYVGSTCNLLSKRLSQHKSNLKLFQSTGEGYTTSFEIVKYSDCYIELLESFACNNKNELNAREGYYIRSIDCVNKVIPDRTQKEYYEDNKEIIVEKKKQYYEENKKTIIENVKQYYEENKEQIKEKKNLKYSCECSGKYTECNKSAHFRSKKHQNYLQLINQSIEYSEGI